MKQLLLILFLFTTAIHSNAQDYATSLIPNDLAKDANMVIRHYSVAFEVESTHKTTKQVHKAITILNKNARDKAHVVLSYDKFREIDDLEVALFDASGNRIRKYRNKDIQDYSATSGFEFFGDNRLKVVEIQHNIYPFTVEYSYKEKSSQTLFYPTFLFLDSEKQALQHATIKISTPESLPLRYKLANIEIETKEVNDDGNLIYQWEVSNLKPIKGEAYGPKAEEIIPRLLTAPVHFEMDNYAGKMDSWKNFGLWINALNKDRDQLPPSLEEKIRQLTADLPDTKAKVAAIYQYLQKNTRYISIQLGIGGFQPFEASFVAEKGYGDCKALTNYTKAMLKAAGIESYYTLVNAGPRARTVQADFPSSQFNHAFLCVPDQQDTIWLECTSQTNPFGYLGRFTNDRNVLLIDEDGGHLIRTPDYSEEQNTQFRTATVDLSATGDAQVKVNTHYKGLQYENIDQLIEEPSAEEQKKMLYKSLDIPAMNITDFQIKASKKPTPEANLSIAMQIRNLGAKTGSRLFVKPNIFNQFERIPKSMSDRESDVVLYTSYYDVDTVHIHLPQGYEIEMLPGAKEYSNQFGEYQMNVSLKDQQLTYIRSFRFHKGRYPAASYTEFRKLLKKARQYDRTKFVLAESEEQKVPTAKK